MAWTDRQKAQVFEAYWSNPNPPCPNCKAKITHPIFSEVAAFSLSAQRAAVR